MQVEADSELPGGVQVFGVVQAEGLGRRRENFRLVCAAGSRNPFELHRVVP